MLRLRGPNSRIIFKSRFVEENNQKDGSVAFVRFCSVQKKNIHFEFFDVKLSEYPQNLHLSTASIVIVIESNTSLMSKFEVKCFNEIYR